MTAYRIAPSLLSADFARLGDEVTRRHRRRRRLDPLRRDGQPLRAEPDLRPDGLRGAAQARGEADGSKVPIDVHLMVEPVDALAAAFAKAGADLISFHPDASTHVDRTLQLIRAEGCKAGLVFNPAAPLDVLEWVIDKVDLVLVMSVNPGFGGQSFIDGGAAQDRAGAQADRRERPRHPARGRRRHQGRQHPPRRRRRRRHLRRRQRDLRPAGLQGGDRRDARAARRVNRKVRTLGAADSATLRRIVHVAQANGSHDRGAWPWRRRLSA